MESVHEEVVKPLLDQINDILQTCKTLPSGKDSALAFENSFPIVRTIKRQAAENISEMMQTLGDQLLQSQQATGSQVNYSLQAAHGTGCLFRSQPSPLDLELLIDINDRLLAVVDDRLEASERSNTETVEQPNTSSASNHTAKRPRTSVDFVPVDEISSSSETWVLQELPTNTAQSGLSIKAQKNRRAFILSVPPEDAAQRLAAKPRTTPVFREAFMDQLLPMENYRKPFRPVVFEKPNAKMSLLSELQSGTPITSDPSYVYPHPYEAELEVFQPSLEQLQSLPLGDGGEPLSNTTPPTQLHYDWPFHYVQDERSFEEMLHHLEQQKVIAVDLEHHSYHSFLGFTCLLQISSTSKDFIVDPLPLAVETMQQLNRVFTNPNIIKVFHGAQNDLMWLQRDFGVYVINLFDTYFACKQLHYPRASYQYLVNRFCGIDINKRFQMVDWRIRPLPRSYLLYACCDTHYLLYVYACLHEALADPQERFQVYQSSRELCLKTYAKPQFQPEQFRVLCNGWAVSVANPVQRAVFKAILSWRWSTAFVRDLSLQCVLPDEMMKKIAEELPKEHTGLLACCNPPPTLLKHHHECRQDLLNIIAHAKATVVASSVEESALAQQENAKGNAREGDTSMCAVDTEGLYLDMDCSPSGDPSLVPLWSRDDLHLALRTATRPTWTPRVFGRDAHLIQRLVDWQTLASWCRDIPEDQGASM